MTLRAWKKEDLGKIAELEKVCFSDPWSVEEFESSFSLPFFQGVLVEDEGKIVAYACAVVVFEDGDIANVAVSPQYRKQGLGKAMLVELEAQAKAKGCERLFLEVREFNSPAIGLYSGFGFEKISLRKHYYPDGENAIVMQKTLTRK